MLVQDKRVQVHGYVLCVTNTLSVKKILIYLHFIGWVQKIVFCNFYDFAQSVVV
jgi:hypothetical protein